MIFEQLKSDFAFDMMWEAAPRRELLVTEFEDVLLAVRKAYADMSVRSIKGWSKVSDAEKKMLLERFSDKFIDAFCKAGTPVLTQEAFDALHDEVCEDFLRELNKLCDKYNLKKQHYGKAQKIVNMTFKYLYLFEKNEPIQPFFALCHMALDSNICGYLKDAFKKHGMRENLFETSWSNLDVGQYQEMQKEIRDYCKKYSSDYADAADEDVKLPFYAEALIWEQTRRKK